jgi:hypothetical protein
MIPVKHNLISTVAGDSNVIGVPLDKLETGIFDLDEYFWVFNAKESVTDLDAASKVAKASGVGLTIVGRAALLDIVIEDTESLPTPFLLYCDIRGTHIVTGERHTGAEFLWRVQPFVGKGPDVGIPVHTTDPPVLTPGPEGPQGIPGPPWTTTWTVLTDKTTAPLPTDNVPLSNALALKADDNAVVKLAGVQTITGNKTFSGTATFGSAATFNGNVTFGAGSTVAAAGAFNVTGTGTHSGTSIYTTTASWAYEGGSEVSHRGALGLTDISTITPGTGVTAALSIAVGTPGSFVVMGGALGTPTSGVGTNLTALNGTNITSGTVADARIAAALTGKTYNGLTITATTGTVTVASGVAVSFPSTGTHSGNNTGDQSSVTGNAGSATVLQTARLINGVSFNGSANIGQDLQPTASPTFTGLTTTNLTVTGTFTHSGATVSITNSTVWRTTLDVGVALASTIGPIAVNLLGTNTMSSFVVETSNAGAITIRIIDIDQIKIGDVWEICQANTGVGQVSTATSIAGQVVTVQFPPGGGPKTAGQYSTIFVRVRAKAGTGAAATATVLVTGGVP